MLPDNLNRLGRPIAAGDPRIYRPVWSKPVMKKLHRVDTRFFPNYVWSPDIVHDTGPSEAFRMRILIHLIALARVSFMASAKRIAKKRC